MEELMKLPIAYYGNPILRKKAGLVTEINQEICQLVEHMIDTMIAHNGVGLAAPQVHHSLALFIAYFEKEDKEIDRTKVRVFINPKIVEYSQTLTVMGEGCLSIPKLYGDIDRPKIITVTALDLNGQPFTETFEDYHAHIVMHENDHLNGVLFIDRLSQKERKILEPRLREIKKKFSSH